MASVKGAASDIPSAPGADAVALEPPRRLGGPFWRLWLATGISASGDGLVTVAVPLLALTITRNPLLIAGITAINRASAAVAALPGGVVADRWDRRSVMVGCNVLAGVTLFALVAALTFGVAELVMVYVVAAVLAACDVTYTLAVQGSLPDLVPPEHLALANGRTMAVEGAGEQFVGPACGGVLFALARRLPFFVDGASFFASAFLVGKNLPRKAPRPRLGTYQSGAGPSDHAVNGDHPVHGETGTVPFEVEGRPEPTSARPRWAADFAQGVRVFRREKALPLLAANISSLAFCQNMIFALLILYAKGTLHLTSTGYGFFVAIASLFGLVGAFFGGSLQRRFGPGPLIIGGTAAALLSYVGLAFTHTVFLAVFVFGLQEIGTVLANVASVTTRQHLIPRELYGRVGSVHRLSVTVSGAIGALLAGLIASV
ncbi:MAG TPA: MFS transporter, partial [Acidimicrobiales bacterium]|nr:MFS transporter [Acidimicrobiales bacterium]